MSDLRILWAYLAAAAHRWWWLPTGVLTGLVTWALDGGDRSAGPFVFGFTALAVATDYLATRAGRHLAALADARRGHGCPHPDHRIRHIHGEEHHRRPGAVAQCMECRATFGDWPKGDHGATRCWTG